MQRFMNMSQTVQSLSYSYILPDSCYV